MRDHPIRADEETYRAIKVWAEKGGGLELKEALRGIVLSVGKPPKEGQSISSQVLDELEEIQKQLLTAKLAKLKEETEYLHMRNLALKNKLPIGLRTMLDQEKDTASTGFEGKWWCKNDRVGIITADEYDAHRESGCILERVS